MNAAQLLENSLQADASIREAATKQLEDAARDNFHGYLHTLAAELANEQSPSHIRRAAGLAFKNALVARDEVNQQPLTERYLTLPDDATTPLKQSLLSTLGSSTSAAGGVAAQCISAVAAIELPVGKWPELIGLLLEFGQNQDNVHLRVNTLQAVGFICEVIRPEILSARSNEILTAVVQGARREEPSAEVQSAAIHALYNSLEFIRDNFEREGERNYIMQVVCEATQSAAGQVQVGAFECLVRIMSLYYEKMEFYMERALFGLTIMGMRHQEEPVVLQAIEFWSTVCEEEIELAQEAQDAASYGEEPILEPKGFAKMALQEILPVLLDLLTQQDEDDDEEDWTKSMAAASCLELLARNVGDAIVQPVVPFVEAGFTHQSWQHRDASVMAFGSILDGPEPTTLAPLVGTALPPLMGMMSSDASPQVRDTVAWTLARICEITLDTVDPQMHLQNLITTLVQGVQGGSPRIVAHCCNALGSCVNQYSLPLPDETNTTSPMSPYYAGILQALMPVSERPSNDENCRAGAYQTIGQFVASATQDTLPVVQDIFIALLARQEALLSMQGQLVGIDDRNNWNDMQIGILSVLQSAIHRAPSMVAPLADRVMTNLLQLISASGRQSGVLEDAFATVGAMASALEGNFQKYLDAFAPFLFNALSSYEDWSVGQAAVYVVGDIARSVGPALTPYAERIMVGLTDILRSPVINRSVKPTAIIAIGDVATAIEGAFVPFLPATMDILSQAGSVAASQNDLIMIEFVWSMREAIVEAFVGIMGGLRTNPEPFRNYVGGIMGFLRGCYADEERTDHFTASLLGLVGDIGEAYKKNVRDELMQDWVTQAISYGRQRGASKTARRNAIFAANVLKEISSK